MFQRPEIKLTSKKCYNDQAKPCDASLKFFNMVNGSIRDVQMGPIWLLVGEPTAYLLAPPWCIKMNLDPRSDRFIKLWFGTFDQSV